MERKLTTILCADVHGYSRLMGADEEATLQTLSAYRRIIDSLIESHRGRFVNAAGDSVLAEFTSVVEAVTCAVEIQDKLKTENAGLPPERRMEFRIGINLGDVIVQDEQIYGDGVNVAARLESLAEPGGICISHTVQDQIGNKLALGYEDLGEQSVKNITKPVRVFRVLPAGTASPRTTQRVARSYLRRSLFSIIGLGIIVATIMLVQHVSLKPPHTSASIPPREKPALPLPDIPSIAVLPFTNLSGDPGQEYFSDGLTDNLITSLSRLPHIFVISRNSTFFYKGKAETVREVGRQLGVRTILQGSVLKAGNRLRINAELADANSGANLWAQRFDRPLTEVFTVQDDIVNRIVTTLSLLFHVHNLEVPQNLTVQPTNNLEAFDDRLRAREYFFHFTKEGNAKARQLLEEAIKLDPNYADAYSAITSTYIQPVVSQWSENPQSDLKRASKFAQKALALDDSSLSALITLAGVDQLEFRPERAVAEMQRAVALNPNYAGSYLFLGAALIDDGMPEQAIPILDKAIRLDPDSKAFYMGVMGFAELTMGRYQTAAQMYEGYLAAYPNDVNARAGLCVAYGELGRERDARAEAAEILRLNPNFKSILPGRSVPLSSLAKQFDADLRKAGLKSCVSEPTFAARCRS